jgi:hypothetical protein
MDINNPRMGVFKTLFQRFLHFINAFFKITRSSYQTFTSLKLNTLQQLFNMNTKNVIHVTAIHVQNLLNTITFITLYSHLNKCLNPIPTFLSNDILLMTSMLNQNLTKTNDLQKFIVVNLLKPQQFNVFK